MNKYTNTLLKAIYFPVRGRSKGLAVPTLEFEGKKYPVTETIMGRDSVGLVKRVSVTIHRGEKMYIFKMFYRYNFSWPQSRAAKECHKDSRWRGDILVFLEGERVDYVGIVDWKQRSLARRAVSEFLTEAQECIEDAKAAGEGEGEPQFPLELAFEIEGGAE
ncbi:hypothetical protein NLJ89_g8344 [Agrocybe chaxingu]|uniref:Uncharacterized protein n=1 Tax=Agrocybe chaxingu TaxID=84603 RepID=A0A9W8MUK6_9AGAR|nr:hypothetical protein NLJ89_g8344 [Agrocybe chaxingu]